MMHIVEPTYPQVVRAWRAVPRALRLCRSRPLVAGTLIRVCHRIGQRAQGGSKGERRSTCQGSHGERSVQLWREKIVHGGFPHSTGVSV